MNEAQNLPDATGSVLSGQTGATASQDTKPTSLVTGQVEFYDHRVYYRDAEREFTNQLQESTQFTPEEAKKVSGSYARHFAALNFTGDQAQDAYRAVRSAHSARPSSEEKAKWADEAKAALVEDFGRERAAQALRDANALLAKNPTLRQNLHTLGLGNHPRIVRALAAKASEARKAGTLK